MIYLDYVLHLYIIFLGNIHFQIFLFSKKRCSITLDSRLKSIFLFSTEGELSFLLNSIVYFLFIAEPKQNKTICELYNKKKPN